MVFREIKHTGSFQICVIENRLLLEMLKVVFLFYLLVVLAEERMTGAAVDRTAAGYVVSGAAGRRQGFCNAPRWRTTQQPLWCARGRTGARAPKISRRPARKKNDIT